MKIDKKSLITRAKTKHDKTVKMLLIKQSGSNCAIESSDNIINPKDDKINERIFHFTEKLDVETLN